MKPGEGFVYVELPKEIDEITTQSGMKFAVDTSYSPGQYANLFGTVLGVPDKINSKSARANKGKSGHFSPDDEMRLKVGDTCYFHYLTIVNAKKSYDRGRYWEEGGKRYALLPYASLFFAVRKEIISTTTQVKNQINTAIICNLTEVKTGIPTTTSESDKVEVTEYIMLNNWLLIEPIQVKQRSETFEKYGTVIIDEERSTGSIALIADNPFKSSEGIVAACPPGLGISIGDNVIFQKESDIPVEYELCRTLEKPFWRMEYKDIVAKREGRGVALIDNYCLVIRDDRSKISKLDIWGAEQLTGTIVQVGPKVETLQVGQHIFFADGVFTEFPHKDQMGFLIREGSILSITNGQKMQRV